MPRKADQPLINHQLVGVIGPAEKRTELEAIVARLNTALARPAIPLVCVDGPLATTANDTLEAFERNHGPVLTKLGPGCRWALLRVGFGRPPAATKKRRRTATVDPPPTQDFTVLSADLTTESAFEAVVDWVKRPMKGVAWVADDPVFVPLGSAGGYLCLFQCISAANLDTVLESAPTHILTLLDDNEAKEAPRVTKIRGLLDMHIQAHTLSWRRVNVGSKAAEMTAARDEMVHALRWVRDAIEGGGHVLIHCIAGRHRTGTMGAALCHLLGLSRSETLLRMHTTRPAATRDVGPGRLAVAWDCLVPAAKALDDAAATLSD